VLTPIRRRRRRRRRRRAADCVIGPGRTAGGAYTTVVIRGVTESDGLRAASDNTFVVCVALLRGTFRYTRISRETYNLTTAETTQVYSIQQVV